MAIVLVLTALLVAPVASPVDAPVASPVDAPVASPVDAPAARRLVFASTYGLHWSILSGTPSGQISLFMGSSLRPLVGRGGRAWKSALGYELGVSVGGADRATSFYSWGGDYGIVYHRHHLAALGHAGPGGRLYYQFGGGLLMFRTTPVALEADVRLGVVLGTSRPGRLKGIVGAESRIVGILGGVPMLHLGLFAGFFIF